MPELLKPILPGDAGSDYERYLRTDELLALQKTDKEWRRVAKPLGEAFHAAHERAGLSLVEVYTRGREFELLYQLAEQLIELDERVIVWRVRHFKVVQRVIGGGAIGTQGTPVEVM